MSMHIKTLVASLGIVIGIWIGFFSTYATPIALVGILLVLVQGGFVLFEKKKNIRSLSFSLGTLLLCLGMFVGIVRVQLVEEKSVYTCESVCSIVATVVKTPEQKNLYQELIVSIDDSHRYISVRTPLYPKYTIGDTLTLTGKILVPENTISHDGEKSFDYVSYLRVHNIGSTMFFPKVIVTDTTAHSISAVLGRVKTDMVTRMNMYVSAPESYLGSGMLFGEDGMSKELVQTFRTSGLSHIVVLSGFNIVIIISAIGVMFKFLPLLLRIIFSVGGVFLFVIATGGEASVIRATLMAFVALLATLVGRKYVARQALIISLVLIILYEPYALIADVSLHLSFLATAGIVYTTEVVQILLMKYRLSKSFAELTATTLSAYVATLPYVMYTFGTMSLYALIANIFVVPLVPLSMLLSFLVVVSSYIHETLGLIVGTMTSYLLHVIIFIADGISRLPFSSVGVTVSLFGMVCLYVVLFVSSYVYAYIIKSKVHVTQNLTEDDTVYTY